MQGIGAKVSFFASSLREEGLIMKEEKRIWQKSLEERLPSRSSVNICLYQRMKFAML